MNILSLAPKKFVKGLSISAIEMLLAFGIGFLSSIIIARYINVEDFGFYLFMNSIALLIFRFSAIGLEVEIQRLSGSSEHIYKEILKLITLNIIVTLIIFVFCVIVLALINWKPENTPLVLIIACTHLLSSNVGMFLAVFAREKNFTFISKVQISRVSVNLIFSFLFIKIGLGVYVLALPQFITGAAAFLYLLIKVDFKPLLTWAYSSAQRLRYTMQSFLEESHNKLPDVTFGIIFSMEIVAYFARANGLISQLYQLVSTLFHRVAFPFNAGGDIDQSERVVLTQYLALKFLYLPVLLFVGMLLPKVIEVLYGAKWLPSVEYVQYLLPIAFLHPLYQQFKTHLIATNMVAKVNRGELYRLIFLVTAFIFAYITNSEVPVFIIIVATSYIGCIYYTLDNICRVLCVHKNLFIALVLFEVFIVFLNYASILFLIFLFIFKSFEGCLYLVTLRKR